MIINTTLDEILLPALPTYQNEFGTKKIDGGLSTAECADFIMRPFRKQRPFFVSENSETTEIQFNCVFSVSAAGITLTLNDASFSGCKVTVLNQSEGIIFVKGGDSGLNGTGKEIYIAKGESHSFTFWNGWHSDLLSFYVVGSVWWSWTDRDPNLYFGGDWIQLKDVFLFAAGETIAVDSTGGSSEVQLEEANLPSHAHNIELQTDEAGAHSHSYRKMGNLEDKLNPSSGSNISRKYSTEQTSEDGLHSHQISGTSNPTGSGLPFSILPPYVGKFCWQRMA